MRKTPGLVSVGYGGRRLRELVEALQREQVEILVDVRLTARSAVPGFSGSALQNSLRVAGIEYRHEGLLGNPPDNRAGYHDRLISARRRFKNVLAGTGREALERLSALARARRVAVLCAERDEGRCHRHEIISAVLQIHPDVTVTSLA